MVFEISEYYTGGKIRLKPRVELYDTRDYMGKQMPGLAIVLDEVDQKENVTEQYAVLTVSFGDFLTLKHLPKKKPPIPRPHYLPTQAPTHNKNMTQGADRTTSEGVRRGKCLEREMGEKKKEKYGKKCSQCICAEGGV